MQNADDEIFQMYQTHNSVQLQKENSIMTLLGYYVNNQKFSRYQLRLYLIINIKADSLLRIRTSGAMQVQAQ